MKKLLWVGDAGVPSGFARATHNILETLRHSYDVTVLGLNYRGDPHGYPYDIWAASAGGDGFGVNRLIWMCDVVKPDVIVIQNDGWNIPFYTHKLRSKKPNGEYAFPEHAAVPVVAIVAVDGKNFNGMWLDGVAHTIFWTDFALKEARDGGYKGPATVIPLGVDREIYRPMDRREIRQARFPQQLQNAFIVGCVNRNQPRKRWDLLVRYFAKWLNEDAIQDAYLFLQTAPTGDMTLDVEELARYYGVVDRLALVTPEVFYGYSEQSIAETYNCFDVNATTSQGEGFGLTTLESMACGVPQILPDWSALGDWAADFALMIPCPTTHIGPPYVNVIGGIPDENAFVEGLRALYTDKNLRDSFAQKALACAQQPQFGWKQIGERYIDALSQVFGGKIKEPRVGEPTVRAGFPARKLQPDLQGAV